MLIDLAELSTSQVYFTMTQTLIPRPVAWVLSDNGDGGYNLAPFSYFAGVTSDPPLVMISIGKKPDGELKDTRVNIRDRHKFVIHIAHRQLAEQLTESSRVLPHGESELDRLTMETVPFEGFELPRLKACRVAYACELYDMQEIGRAKQGVIFGEVKRIYVDDAVVTTDAKGRTKYRADLIDPIGRLGGTEYTSFGEIIDIPRPS